jgi:phosphatidate cytidylyltransferase
MRVSAPTPPDQVSPKNSGRDRIIFGLAAFLITLLAIWVGFPLLAPVYLLLSCIALYEYSALLKLRGISIQLRSLWLAAALTVPASLPTKVLGVNPPIEGLSWRVLLLALFVIYVITLKLFWPKKYSLNNVVATIFGYLYIPWLFAFVLTLRYTPDGILGLWSLTIPMLAVIGADTGGFLFGTLFGRRKLIPRISPKKTVEGALGGLGLAIICIVCSLAILQMLSNPNPYIGWGDGIVMGLLAATGAQLGDLIESLFKRWAGVKDAGVLLPGHGGVLDRIDSVIVAIPTAYFFLTLFVVGK